MYTLYWDAGGANMAPHAVLEELGQPFRLERVDLAKGEQHRVQYLRLNPHRRVPTLIEDGRVIYESAAILLYLCEQHPSAELMPGILDPERALFLRWLFYLTNTVQEELGHWWHPDGFMSSAAGRREMKDVAERRLAGMWEFIDDELKKGPYLLGPRFSAVDYFLVMLCRWSRAMVKPATAYPRLKRCIDRVSARPAWQRMMQAEGITWTGALPAENEEV